MSRTAGQGIAVEKMRPEATVLENPAWSSLTGAHAHLAEGTGLARRYPADVSPFHAIADPGEPQAWVDLATLVGPAGLAVLTGSPNAVPATWTVVDGGQGVQMVGWDVDGEPDPALLPLGAPDVPEMLDLVARTQPGPFERRTVELGGYLGFRKNGTLVAMAGRRLAPEGFVEISAVCTDESARRQGLAARLVLAVAAGIRADGATPMLHAAGGNVGAIRVYERLGFELVRRPEFALVRAPG